MSSLFVYAPIYSDNVWNFGHWGLEALREARPGALILRCHVGYKAQILKRVGMSRHGLDIKRVLLLYTCIVQEVPIFRMKIRRNFGCISLYSITWIGQIWVMNVVIDE